MPIKGDFDLMWKNYPIGFGHDPSLSDTEDEDRIEKLNEKLRIKIGGKVNNSDYKNLCAIRLSYSLNRSGYKIPGDKLLKWYNKPYTVALGGDGYFYGRGVIETLHYLEESYGKPDFEFDGPFGTLSTNVVIPEKLKSKKGIILFLVKEWVDAQGHVTLWDGAKCSDNPYFHKAHKVMIWEVVKPDATGRSVRIHNLNDAIRVVARPIPQDSAH